MMSEQQPTPSTPEARPVAEQEAPDFRRLEVAYGRFAPYITEGINTALTEGAEIDDGTARCIAHVLGRAHGQASALGTFGRTGEGNYLTLRDEYLNLYSDERADGVIKELIDWFGTFLVKRENTSTGRRSESEHLPPKLGQLLVRTRVRVGGSSFTVNIPASWDSGQVDGLIETINDLQLPEDDALQAFLSLPDINAGTDDIMESFHEAFAVTYATEEDALRALSPLEEWETSLADWCIDNGLEPETLEWNYAPLAQRLRDVYDLVEHGGHIHAFVK